MIANGSSQNLYLSPQQTLKKEKLAIKINLALFFNIGWKISYYEKVFSSSRRNLSAFKLRG